MNNSTKDQLQGKAEELKGKVKETIGHLTNDPCLKEEGQDQQAAGFLQKKIGQIEKVFEK